MSKSTEELLKGTYTIEELLGGTQSENTGAGENEGEEREDEDDEDDEEEVRTQQNRAFLFSSL